MQSQWLEFYRGTAADSEGRNIHDILAWDDSELEAVHDYIQWLFPLPEPSRFNPNAPLLTESDIASAKGDEHIQANLRAAFERMLLFYGLTQDTAEKPKPWLRAGDHNHLRLTRILRSLCLLGLRDEARQLYDALDVFAASIPERTRQFWRAAIAS
jgi:hypothetical protein